MPTTAEIKKMAARKLGYSIYRDLSSQWDTQMQDAYDETYKELDAMNLVSWAQTGTVPDSVANDFATLMAWKRADVLATQETIVRMKPQYMAERDYRRAFVIPYESIDDPTDF